MKGIILVVLWMVGVGRTGGRAGGWPTGEGGTRGPAVGP